MLKKRTWAFVVAILLLPLAAIIDVSILWYALIFSLIGLWPIIRPMEAIRRMPLIKKVISIFVCLLLMPASVATWFAIVIAFDGCCGAPINRSNDGLQQLTVIIAATVILVIAGVFLRWGWRKPRP